MKTSVALSLAALVLVACAPTSVMVTSVPSSMPTITPEWTTPTLTPLPYYGYLEFPFLNADAGNFQLQTGATLAFKWVDPPPDALSYEIVLYPLDGGDIIPLGKDDDPSDGVTLAWTVPPNLAAELKAFAYYGGGQPVLTFSGLYVYSPSMPQ